jgi:hypothetical protein
LFGSERLSVVNEDLPVRSERLCICDKTYAIARLKINKRSQCSAATNNEAQPLPKISFKKKGQRGDMTAIILRFYIT